MKLTAGIQRASGPGFSPWVKQDNLEILENVLAGVWPFAFPTQPAGFILPGKSGAADLPFQIVRGPAIVFKQSERRVFAGVNLQFQRAAGKLTGVLDDRAQRQNGPLTDINGN